MRLAAQLCAPAAPASASSAPPLAAPLEVALTTAPARLLDDSQVRSFISNGFLELDLDEVPPEFHRAVHDKGKQVHEGALGAIGPGNNVYVAIPQLRAIMQGPTVRGALTSVLGEGYFMHAHRYMHVTRVGGDQSFHKDGQSGHGPIRHHRPRWAMIMVSSLHRHRVPPANPPAPPPLVRQP